MKNILNSLGFEKSPKDTTIVVAMSGGVDSSTVAGMMKKEGYKVIGITLKLYDDNKEVAASKTCCSGQDIFDAKRVANKLNIEHKILYYQNKFKEGVIDNFVDSYLKGETPIPCECYGQAPSAGHAAVDQSVPRPRLHPCTGSGRTAVCPSPPAHPCHSQTAW
mgnify:CR=1 FL=1